MAGPGLYPVCRFFSTAFAPKSSHFYTPYPDECESLKAGAVWAYEADAFFLQLPDMIGNCATDTTTLYCLYNNGMSGAPNHRYTNNRNVWEQMKAQGWIFEGNTGTGAFACVPL
ncbi:MAG: hypothetical protein HY777_07190 [Betaproteobacteria bacterium]|nr:hypothetical protein [Betaproteobacteria bacterium]